MDSFNGTTARTARFNYNPNSEADGEDGFSGLLETYVHHARNIHNICIYENQDVYAKLSLTCNPDETLSTRVINGGGKNPDFNENISFKITQLDSVLKCEIWMFSRARNYLEDQLLGFALVPMSLVAGKGKITQEFTLSSTDLFHSPAGTIRLTLFLDTSYALNLAGSKLADSSSISSEVVLLDRKVSEVVLYPVEYGRIEFPDINVARENQQMVSEYYERSCGMPTVLYGPPGSFLHLGASTNSQDDYEMTFNSSEDNSGGSVSPNGSIQNSGLFNSTTSSLSDDRNSMGSLEKKSRLVDRSDSSNSNIASISADVHQGSGASPETPTSKKDNNDVEGKKDHQEEHDLKENNPNEFGQVFTAPIGNINLDAEQAAMQQQIVDMYMRSMQQFTESLAKMKLPMDLDKPEPLDNGDVIQQHNNKVDLDEKKDGSRVFYGSRAFF